MKRRRARRAARSAASLLAAAAGMAAAGALGACMEQPPERPDIVFILVDDLRWDALGATGHPVARTPNIDRLAKEGARFANFFVSTPICSPSRSSFLTGQYAHTTGILDNQPRSVRSHQLETFPMRLREVGYETAYVGKWHMGNDASPRPGFDHWVGFAGQGVYENPDLNVDGRIVRESGYTTDILNRRALAFVERPHAKPFVLYLAHKAVHSPITPAQRHASLYADAKVPSAPNRSATSEGKPALARARTVERGQPGGTGRRRPAGSEAKLRGAPGDHDHRMRQQLRALGAVDEGGGQLLRALAASGRLDDTLIVFTSDNGFFWGEHGLNDKRWAYEESIRAPLLVRHPGLIEAGSTFAALASNLDIAPTLLELAGAPVPAAMHGRSLLPLFRDPKAAWRTSLLAEYFRDGDVPVPSWQAVRTERWKYIHYPDSQGLDELYDLEADPYETRNVIAQPDAGPALAAMQAELAKLLKETGAK